ncbi:MAG: hypothetical protein R6V85_02725 [Polyangia bacterium]
MSLFFRTLIVAMAASLSVALSIGACGATDNSDGGGDSDSDSDGDADSDSDGDADTTIYDIRQGNVAEESQVTLSGVVVTSPVHVEDSVVFVEEPEAGQYSGIYLYMYSEVLAEHGEDLTPGAVIDVSGEYTEFYGVSEVTVQAPGDLAVSDYGDVPGPDVVDPADIETGGSLAEAYESVLVRVENVEVTQADLGYGNFELTGGLIVDDFFFEEGGGPSGPHLEPGQGDTFDAVVGPLRYSYEEFQISPRDMDDFIGYSGEVDTDTDTGADTIYDVQQGNVSENDVVTIEGAIVTSPVHEEEQYVFIEDPQAGAFSGILLYLYNEPFAAADLQRGDVVDVTGEYQEYYDMSQIVVQNTGDLVETGTASLPAPEVVSSADVATGGSQAEDYEGVLVEIESPTVTNTDAGYGQFEVDDTLLVDDFFFSGGQGPSGEMPAVAVGDGFTALRGVLIYHFDDFKLAPRDSDDFVN